MIGKTRGKAGGDVLFTRVFREDSTKMTFAKRPENVARVVV